MPINRSIAVLFSFVLFLIWTLVTYLLEGRLLTLLRPEAVLNRFIYTMAANILVGTVGSVILIRFLLDRTANSDPALFGLTGSGRLIFGIAVGLGLGLVFFFVQSFSSRHPVLILNAYSQVLVVSMAEVIVCWVLVGGSIANINPHPFYIIMAVIVSALVFGLYHFAHSPPFNTFKMVMMLSVVGLFTGTFYFLTRSVYGTILFHNFMGMKGVTDALAANGRIESFKTLQIPIVTTAFMAVLILVLLDVMVLRRTTGYQ